MLKHLIVVLNFVILIYPIVAQEKKSPFSFEISETDDITSVVSGGIKSGEVVSMGMFNLKAIFDAEKAHIWKGGSLTIHLLNTHGATPSADYAGDLQVYSNIEAGNHTGLFELFYSQKIQNFELKAGWNDLCNDFYCPNFGGLFLNSSFGISPGASLNLPVSIYPVTAPFVYAGYSFNTKSKLQFASYAGNPGDIESNRYNLKWDISCENGFLNIIEYQYLSDNENYTGLKTGLYIHTADAQGLKDSSEVYNNCYGFYTVIDKNIIQPGNNSNKGLDAFLQIDFAPSDRCEVNYYLGAGLSYRGLFAKEKIKDEIGFGVAYMKMSKYWTRAESQRKDNETALEFTYRLNIFDHIYIEPDFQYIIHPGAGSNGDLRNTLVSTLRLILY
jgi:porin